MLTPATAPIKTMVIEPMVIKLIDTMVTEMPIAIKTETIETMVIETMPIQLIELMITSPGTPPAYLDQDATT